MPITQLDKLRPTRCGKVLADVTASYIWHRSTYLKAVICKLTIYDSIMHEINTRQHFRNCRIIRLSKVSPNIVVWLVVPMRIRRVLGRETQYLDPISGKSLVAASHLHLPDRSFLQQPMGFILLTYSMEQSPS